MIEPTCKGHGGIMNCRHLRREHGLDLVARFYALDDGEHEVKPILVHRAPM